MAHLKVLAQRWGWLLLAGYAAVFFFQQTNLVTSDLGRHIINGRIILSSGEIFQTNLYSYTAPLYSMVNHHWFFGVLAYLVHQVGSFGLLTIFNTGLLFIALAAVLHVAWHQYGAWATALAWLLTLPLLTSRTEVRPETISMLLSALLGWVLHRYEQGILKSWVVGVVVLGSAVVWINTHVFFLLGGGILGYFWLRRLLAQDWQRVQALSFLGLAQSLFWLLNPNRIWGILEPLRIFEDYGYRIVENQPIWELLRLVPQPQYWYLLIAVVVLGVLQIWRLALHPKSTAWADTAFVLVLSVGTLWVYRLISFYGLLVLPITAHTLQILGQHYYPGIRKWLATTSGTMVASLTGFSAGVVLLGSGLLTPGFGQMGIGLLPQNNRAAAFWEDAQLEGPIFNNYDIGGYLIYHLYPTEKVFTDNRPEAYPPEHFTDVYIPAQQDDIKWQALDQQYNFNAIFFHRNDLTEWAQAFLVRMVQDEAWVPVFVDDWTIILLKNTDQNRATIDQFRLPQELFRVSTPESY